MLLLSRVLQWLLMSTTDIYNESMRTRLPRVNTKTCLRELNRAEVLLFAPACRNTQNSCADVLNPRTGVQLQANLLEVSGGTTSDDFSVQGSIQLKSSLRCEQHNGERAQKIKISFCYALAHFAAYCQPLYSVFCTPNSCWIFCLLRTTRREWYENGTTVSEKLR